MNNTILETFGNIDIYLFDQLMKGRFDHCKKIIDVGCGGGRNIHYFLKNGFDVYGVDMGAEAVFAVRELAPHIPAEHFVVAKAEDIPFADGMFDLAICSAVLHFAKDKAHFEAMLHEIWRVLQRGGLLFARLASDIGIEGLVKPIGDGQYLLPDGSTRYLVSQEDLEHYTRVLNGALFEPIKTTNVSNLRAMTTWCVVKK